MWRRDQIALFKRSSHVAHDYGLWHCVTGYLEAPNTGDQQAVIELCEETGLLVSDLIALSRGPVLKLESASGAGWAVHTYRANTLRNRLRLDWEHDSYMWIYPGMLCRFKHVPWLPEVVHAAPKGPLVVERGRVVSQSGL